MIRIAPLRFLSPTSINTYLSCPRKFYLRYIKKLKTKPSIYLVRGSIVHRVFCRFNQLQTKPSLKMTPLELQLTLLGLFEEEWKKAGDSLASLGMEETRLQDFRDESQLMVINFGFWLERCGLSPAQRAEVKMFSKKLGLMGVVDAIHEVGGEPILVDYKTSRRPEITPDIQRQAAIYALLYQDFRGKPPSEIWIHFVAQDRGPEVIQVDEHLIQYGDILVESIRAKTKTFDEKDYPCTCGGRCEREFAMS